jgi:hypothetical protein
MFLQTNGAWKVFGRDNVVMGSSKSGRRSGLPAARSTATMLLVQSVDRDQRVAETLGLTIENAIDGRLRGGELKR